jgi:hypothetical protein
MEGEQPADVEPCSQRHVAAVEVTWHEAYLSTEFYCEACGADWLQAYYD